MRAIQPSMRDGNRQLMRCFQSFAVFELLKNSQYLYIHTPILQDTRLLTNNAGEFTPALPDASWQYLHLSQFLTLLAERETNIYIRYRDPLDALMNAHLQHPRIRLSQHNTTYPPGWITESYTISGVMYFRPEGVNFFDNEIVISTERQDVDKLLLTAQSTW